MHIYYYYIFHLDFSPINGCLLLIRVKWFLYFSSIFIAIYSAYGHCNTVVIIIILNLLYLLFMYVESNKVGDR